MDKLHGALAVVALCATTLPATAGRAQPAPQVSLNNCQKAAREESGKFLRREISAITFCLQKISAELIGKNVATPANAASSCVRQFRKVNDTRGAGKSLKERLTTKVRNKCDPTFNSALTHTVDDVTGKGAPTVPQHIKTEQIDLWCQRFGGDGSIDTVGEWINCVAAAHECEARQAIAEQYPRVSEWLTAVRPAMLLVVSPSSDTTRTSDAVAGLDAADAAIDADSDNRPDIQCGQTPTPSCSTACCYIEQPVGVGVPTSCFEYTAPASQIAAFITNCTGKVSSPPFFWQMTPTSGACVAGPSSGVPCFNGGAGNNYVQVPKYATCP